MNVHIYKYCTEKEEETWCLATIRSSSCCLLSRAVGQHKCLDVDPQRHRFLSVSVRYIVLSTTVASAFRLELRSTSQFARTVSCRYRSDCHVNQRWCAVEVESDTIYSGASRRHYLRPRLVPCSDGWGVAEPMP